LRHSNVQALLYDYLRNNLNAEDIRRVEEHLAKCVTCRNDLKELENTLSLFPHPPTQPSDMKDHAYWTSLANRIDKEVQMSARPRPHFFHELFEKARVFFAFRPVHAYAIGGSLASILLVMILFRWQPTDEKHVADIQPGQNDSTIMLSRFYENQERISQYFRRSGTLLVGIANMKEDALADLSAERRVSRDLIHEARFVRMQPINSRTEKLVHDLEKILIELANTEEETDLPNVELIRSGIHQENLLFKIRMAEASFDTSANPFPKRIY
jgi:hypothetical protein